MRVLAVEDETRMARLVKRGLELVKRGLEESGTRWTWPRTARGL